jgi:hypothetical protein
MAIASRHETSKGPVSLRYLLALQRVLLAHLN